MHLLLHRFRQVVIFGGHEAAEAHAVVALERSPKNIGIPAQAADGIRGFGQHSLQLICCVLPIAPRYSRAEIGLAREVVVYARALNAHVFGEIAEIQATVSMRLSSPSGCCQ